MYIQPTVGQCEELRDSLCRNEWESALSFGIALPNCNQFPVNQATCAQPDNMTVDILTSPEEMNEEGT